MILSVYYSGRGVTANIHDLGSCDSGFESQRSDHMSFIRNKEDFICEKCGFLNKGNGYTNHCSNCIFSKHVDNEPGDRLNQCLGLMKPIYVSYTNKDKYIMHRCEKCGLEKKNLIQIGDNIDTLINIQKSI